MIEGLKLRITAEELVEHCQKRAEYHKDRAKTKEGQLPILRESLSVLKDVGSKSVSSMGKVGYNSNPDDPIEDLEKDILEHKNKALVFYFFANHFFPEEYTLKEEDLIRLEILKR